MLALSHTHRVFGYAMLLTALMMPAVSCADDSYEREILPLLAKYCVACHSGDEPSAKLDFSIIKTQQDANASFETWRRVVELLKSGEMPPEDEERPSRLDIENIETWYRSRFIENVEARPADFRPRRLSAYEYRNTLRSLFGFDLEVNIIEAEQTIAEKSLVMKLLPLDPPGKSGFRNDTSGNPLTTVIWDQYSYLVDAGLEAFFSPRHQTDLEAYSGPILVSGVSLDQAETLLQSFMTRAYRRQVENSELGRRMIHIKEAGSSEEIVDRLKSELKVVLMSPEFLYRGLLMRGNPGQQSVDQYELAERLSYFIWGDMPDAELMRNASSGNLSKSEIYRSEIVRLLNDPKSRNLAEDFAVQWFSLDEIDHVSDNVPYAVALKSQPLDFVKYLFAADRPLLELIDSDVAYFNTLTSRFYPQDRKQLARYRKPKGIEVEIVPNQQITLQDTSERGGLLTMPGVLAMNKGPVLRGVWMLERLLGEPLPEPPPDVGQIPQNRNGQSLTFRERFELHRSKPACAVCHDKIDPLGFSLERYDKSGAFVTKSGETIDTSGQLPSGEIFTTYQELKEILVTSQRDQIVRNIVQKTLSYALCRKLKYYDRPAVDKIVNELNQRDGTYRDLIRLVAESMPFRETIIKGESE
ncbi:DUF1592 domain-containing protein [Planctomycetaceae bacterium]|jgi:hypothetical protein|nr:DUF1592 domain-containing protein [Planctomycetaceae bacterium]